MEVEAKPYLSQWATEEEIETHMHRLAEEKRGAQAGRRCRRRLIREAIGSQLNRLECGKPQSQSIE